MYCSEYFHGVTTVSFFSFLRIAAAEDYLDTDVPNHNFGNIFERLRLLQFTCDVENYEEYLTVDDALESAPVLTDTDIIQEIQSKRMRISSNSQSSDEEEEMASPQPPPTVKEAARAITTLQHYFECSEVCSTDEKERAFIFLGKLDANLLKCAASTSVQTKITDFFHAPL
jgi:hypothetical protein